MKIKELKAIAIVNKKRPRLNVLDIYSLKDKDQVRISKEEKIINVIIKTCTQK